MAKRILYLAFALLLLGAGLFNFIKLEDYSRSARLKALADAQAETASLVRQRLQAGESAGGDDSHAREQARTARAPVAGLEADARAAAYALALLTGHDISHNKIYHNVPAPLRPGIIPRNTDEDRVTGHAGRTRRFLVFDVQSFSYFLN